MSARAGEGPQNAVPGGVSDAGEPVVRKPSATGPGPSGTGPEPSATRPGPTRRRTYRALVVTASNRAAAGVYADTGGPILAEGLAALGFSVDGPEVVPDGEPVERALRAGVAAAYDVILTTGGTGISPTDRTADVTRRVIDYEIPGIPEAIRAEGAVKVPTAALSRGLAGVAGRTLIVNLPGSTGGVRDGLAVLDRLLVHAVDQIHGGDHPRTDHPRTDQLRTDHPRTSG
ncbi:MULTISPECIES: MogA/MoaB family molybdenum cofactor biosynthesis protein [unclassified Streptomyces]|uniref:MogA/MoaB family molybdenum cofactor biosynthesis protein n=1 Tax=Streptomyces sp. SID4917 TaxID=2690269 RepID=UPI00081EDDA2|nr:MULTISPECIES: MogA/MoaB family molybdenum cofactor biosynthesis protein [unclassified Streptomyces]MYZ37804.1 MogA/MoaB family molybdenum cofactor biosynthesis protein [Streptomyces sp. SID4917]SCF94268.1 molybdenum cofactor synthesis domain-containing protein [Streptomyces sp. MnatMP-M17]